MAPSLLERALSRALRPFARIEAHESAGTVVLALTSFLLLTAYYLLKTAREPLILLHGGAEVKSYAAAGQAALLLVFVHAYASLARRVGRMRLLTSVYLFFAANILVFAALARAGVSIGVPFFLWVGVFNYTATAQFWAFAADVYLPEQGKRIFAVLGIGSSLGAVAGARIAGAIAPLGPSAMMLGAAGLLVVCVAHYALAAKLVRRSEPTAATAEANEPLSTEGPFQLLLRDRYLLLIAALTLLLNWCNANGEYILDRTLLASLDEARQQGTSAMAFIATFKAQYFEWVNIAGVALQLFAVSRVVARFGLRGALLVLPVVAFIGYGMVFAAPLLALVRIAKVAENSLDYSLQNTARQALYLVTSRPEKYIGKTVVDTFLVRAGDALSALGVLVASQVRLSTRSFAALNLGLIALWALVVLAIGGEHSRRARQTPEQLALEPVVRRKRALGMVLTLVAAGVLTTRAVGAEEPAKRQLPDYAGRQPPPPTAGEVLLWVPRVVFSPVYFTTEYLLRRPIGAAEIALERSDVPRALYDFFVFGPDHKAGIMPVAFVDFGVNPSVGLYGFWDDALFKGDDLRAHAVAWPNAWAGGSAVQRIRFGEGNAVVFRLEGVRRPDYPFYGLGPRTLHSARSRYGADNLAANAAISFAFWRASKIEAGVGVRYASFYDGHYAHDRGIVESAAAGTFVLPPSFGTGYAAELNHLGIALDSRRGFPHDGTGVRLEANADQGSGFGPIAAGGWIRYEAGAAASVDLDGHRRVVTLSTKASFADPLGRTPVPFTELVTFGGDKAPMPGFLPGRMIDRSGAVGTLRYTWPIGPWLGGSVQASLGNVFGEHMQGFETRLMRLSGALGIQSDSSPDSNFQVLVGFGSETFDQGGKIDSFRLAIGTTTGL
jgi:AAA family ATP:ADP antiporter